MASKTKKTTTAEPEDTTVELAQIIAAANNPAPAPKEPKAPPPGPLPAGPAIVGSLEAVAVAVGSAYQGAGIAGVAAVAGAGAATVAGVAAHKVRTSRAGRKNRAAAVKAAGRRNSGTGGTSGSAGSLSGGLLGGGGGRRGGGGKRGGRGGLGLLSPKSGGGAGLRLPGPGKTKSAGGSSTGSGPGSGGPKPKPGKGSGGAATGSGGEGGLFGTKTGKDTAGQHGKDKGGRRRGWLGTGRKNKNKGKGRDKHSKDKPEKAPKTTDDKTAPDAVDPEAKDAEGEKDKRKGPKDGVASPKKGKAGGEKGTVKFARLRALKDKFDHTKLGRTIKRVANTRLGKWTRRHFKSLWAWGTGKGGRRVLRWLHIGAVGLLALSTAGLVTVPALLAGMLTLVPSVFSKEHAEEHGWNIHPLAWPKAVYIRVYETAGLYTHLNTDPDVVLVPDAEDPGDSGITSGPATTAAPEPIDTSARLGAALTTNYANRSYFARSAANVAAAYMRYDPPAMLAVAAEYRGVPQGIRHAAKAIRHLADLSGNYPTTSRVVALIHAIAALVDKAAKTADQVEPHFRKVHAADLAKYEAPRQGEELWNILKRRLDGTMPKSVFEKAAQETAVVYRKYTPEHMIKEGTVTAAAEFDGIGAGLASLAMAIKHMHRRSDERYPVDKSVVGLIASVVLTLKRAQAAARELAIAFRKDNAHDIQRHEKPRNGRMGEAMWDA
ncbi:hypothetical protein [Streptomyces violascens]|uniref:hypothetical protein n=1 Tax=Streptomyces violascens TaxID=67381 RepID=UPI0036C00C75